MVVRKPLESYFEKSPSYFGHVEPLLKRKRRGGAFFDVVLNTAMPERDKWLQTVNSYSH